MWSQMQQSLLHLSGTARAIESCEFSTCIEMWDTECMLNACWMHAECNTYQRKISVEHNVSRPSLWSSAPSLVKVLEAAGRVCSEHRDACAVITSSEQVNCAESLESGENSLNARRILESVAGIHSFVRSFVHSFIHSCIHAFMHSCIHPFIHSSIHPFIHSSIHSFIHSFMHSFIHFISFHVMSFHFISFHSFIHSCIHSFISFHFISCHFISFHFMSFIHSFHFISFHFMSFHVMSFHFMSSIHSFIHFISCHFISFHFITLHSFIHSFIHSCIHSFIHSFIYSFHFIHSIHLNLRHVESCYSVQRLVEDFGGPFSPNNLILIHVFLFKKMHMSCFLMQNRMSWNLANVQT